MLNFFRKYERYFFLVITVVIIISFSFFGTYSTLGSNTWREQVAFKAINGHDVLSFDLDEMALFLATDAEEKAYFGGMWGPNFLNDGVIRKDFLENGLAQELALAYPDEIREDIDKKAVKEKKYTLYTHPQAPYIGVESIWRYFAPQMSVYYNTMQSTQDGLDRGAFNSRVNLFLAEKQIPASTLRNILRYQEKQYQWLKTDERLNQTELALFGYHTLEDWFGPRFTRLVSEFIINAAIVAEQQGYEVTKAEALTDLVRNTQLSYQQNVNNPNLGVTSPEEYLNEQLRRMNMDQARAIKIWRQVLLFRRYFDDAGANALVDTLPNQKIHQYAKQEAAVDLYRLPSHLRLSTFNDLQKFEAYLYAATKQNKADVLAIPEQYLPIADISRKYPELVQKRYVLEVAQVSQKTLQSQIGLKDLWNWEVDDQHWKTLAKQFPILGAQLAKNREERFEALDDLDAKARIEVDNFAKKAIVQSHPEWIEKSLENAKLEKVIVGLRSQGGKMPFSGLDDKEKREKFIVLLDEAPIGSTIAIDSPLFNFSADQQVYYRIAVIDRADAQEILTFSEAAADGTLNTILNRILEQYYVANRGKDASLYQNDKGEWKPLSDVKEEVAEQFFKKIVQALKPHLPEDSKTADAKADNKDQAASMRMYAYVNKIKESLEKGDAKADQWILSSAPESPSLADQWKIEKTQENLSRDSELSDVLEIGDALALNENEWSSLNKPSNGDLAFYQVKAKGEASVDAEQLSKQIREIQSVLGAEAQRSLMQQILADLKSHDAISLAYLNRPIEESLGETELD